MKVSDYVMDFLYREGTTHVFTVSGGGIMHLLDSLARHSGLRYTCNYHEQACAIAAEGYSRVHTALGACLVTTGPGSTNALSGVAGAWVDSIPLLVVSGQVRRDLIADYSKVRQLGPQEINIDAMARPVTKYFTTIMDPTRIRYELEKAVSIARHGRPGPVWVNIPLDVQGASVDESALSAFDVLTEAAPARRGELDLQVDEVYRRLRRSKRPVIVAGNGIRLANAHGVFERFVEHLGVPVLPTIGGTDAIHETHPCFVGRFGPLGQRRANFAIQNSDVILAVGASLSVATTGFNTESFAPRAAKIMVNIDPHEIAKVRPAPDVGIAADAGEFMERMLAAPPPMWGDTLEAWWRACRRWRTEYPAVPPDCHVDAAHVNSYVFADVLSDLLQDDDVVVTGNSLDWWSVYQAFKVKRGQRVFTNVNFGAMGWDIPAAIGACSARGGRRTVLVTGDGTFQFNIQELQTIAHHRLPIKIFVLNNGGYASIRSMQKTHFGGRLAGADETSGVSNPDFPSIAAAYGCRHVLVAANAELAPAIQSVIDGPAAALCEVIIDPAQDRYPKVMSRRREDGSMESGTLENMYPFLPPQEIARNMRMFETEER